MLELLESLSPLFLAVVNYIFGYCVGVLDTKKRFNIPKDVKTAKQLEEHLNGNEYGTT